MENLTKLAETVVSGDIFTIEDEEGLTALPEGTIIADSDGDIIFEDYEDEATGFLPAIVLNPEHLGYFKAVATFKVGDKVQIHEQAVTHGHELGAKGHRAYVRESFKGETGTIDSTDYHAREGYGYTVMLEHGDTNLIGENSLTLVPTPTIAAGTWLRLSKVRGTFAAENGALAQVTEDFFGEGYLRIRWHAGDPRARTQNSGGYYVEDFEVLESEPDLGVIRGTSMASFKGLPVEDRGAGEYRRYLPLANRPDGFARSAFKWEPADVLLGTTTLPVEPTPEPLAEWERALLEEPEYPTAVGQRVEFLEKYGSGVIEGDTGVITYVGSGWRNSLVSVRIDRLGATRDAYAFRMKVIEPEESFSFVDASGDWWTLVDEKWVLHREEHGNDPVLRREDNYGLGYSIEEMVDGFGVTDPTPEPEVEINRLEGLPVVHDDAGLDALPQYSVVVPTTGIHVPFVKDGETEWRNSGTSNTRLVRRLAREGGVIVVLNYDDAQALKRR